MAIDPFSALGTAWTIGTSVAKVFQWRDEDKQVDGEWLAASGFEKVCDEMRATRFVADMVARPPSRRADALGE